MSTPNHGFRFIYEEVSLFPKEVVNRFYNIVKNEIMVKLKVKKISPEVQLPEYGTEESAGFDLRVFSFKQLRNHKGKFDLSEENKLKHSISQGYVNLRPNERILIGTGLFFEIPTGYEVQIRDRSSVSLKTGLKVMNAPGTIDSDYRGELGIIIVNLSKKLQRINVGDRIAQGVLSPVIKASFEETKELGLTKRAEGGFGSTGQR